jgi:microcystin-dependent protein
MNFYTDALWVRFQRGRPRKIGGYRAITSDANGYSRGLYVNSTDGNNQVFNGYNNGLEVLNINNLGIGSGVGLTTRNLGDTGGEETHTLTLSEIPSHSHTGNTSTVSSHTHTGTTDAAGSHSHTYNDAYFAENQGGAGGNFGTNADTDNDNSFRWRTAAGGNSDTPQDIETGSSGGHTHSVTDAGHTHTFTANITDPGHTHTFTTEETGGDASHSNVQPTLYAGNLFIFAKFVS